MNNPNKYKKVIVNDHKLKKFKRWIKNLISTVLGSFQKNKINK